MRHEMGTNIRSILQRRDDGSLRSEKIGTEFGRESLLRCPQELFNEDIRDRAEVWPYFFVDDPEGRSAAARSTRFKVGT